MSPFIFPQREFFYKFLAFSNFVMPRNTRIFIYDVDFDDENAENAIEPGDLIEWDNIYLNQSIMGPFHFIWTI